MVFLTHFFLFDYFLFRSLFLLSNNLLRLFYYLHNFFSYLLADLRQKNSPASAASTRPPSASSNVGN